MNAGYGIKRLKSMVNFMDKEDWSERLPELKEWIQLIDRTRGTDFAQTFPELASLLK
jgi:hypothetical protein